MSTPIAKPRKKTKTYAELQRKVMELEAQLAHVPHYASREVEKASTDHLMGSGVIIQLHALGGRELMKPIMIRDGLSKDTIEALQRDIKRTYDQMVSLKP